MIGPTDLLHPSPTPHFKTFHVFLIYCPKRPSPSVQVSAPLSQHIRSKRTDTGAENIHLAMMKVLKYRMLLLWMS
jgi:hypothetical protein